MWSFDSLKRDLDAESFEYSCNNATKTIFFTLFSHSSVPYFGKTEFVSDFVIITLVDLFPGSLIQSVIETHKTEYKQLQDHCKELSEAVHRIVNISVGFNKENYFYIQAFCVNIPSVQHVLTFDFYKEAISVMMNNLEDFHKKCGLGEEEILKYY